VFCKANKKVQWTFLNGERSNPVDGKERSAMAPLRLDNKYQLDCFARARNDGNKKSRRSGISQTQRITR
jgi:hypothetical protein